MFERSGMESRQDGGADLAGGIAPDKDTTSTHDVGFEIFTSFGKPPRRTREQMHLANYRQRCRPPRTASLRQRRSCPPLVMTTPLAGKVGAEECGCLCPLGGWMDTDRRGLAAACGKVPSASSATSTAVVLC
jgi:hypothetical protein